MLGDLSTGPWDGRSPVRVRRSSIRRRTVYQPFLRGVGEGVDRPHPVKPLTPSSCSKYGRPAHRPMAWQGGLHLVTLRKCGPIGRFVMFADPENSVLRNG